MELERLISPQVEASPLLSSASPSSYLNRPQERQQLATPTVGVSSPFSGTVVASSYSVPGHSVHSDQEQPGSSSGIALFSHPGDASRIHRNLLLEVSGILRDADSCSGPSTATLDVEADLDTVLRIMHKCIDLFVQYFFPNTPIAHEPSLRRAVSDFASGLPLVLSADAAPGDQVFSMRSFTLITALCAFITSVVPDMAVPHSISLTWPFYHASRAMTRLYEEFDLESPVSSSYTSRIWQSAALQNVTGKNPVAWHVSGEVTIMALRTRLYDEKTVSSQAVGKLESQLLRANFWLIYLSDRTATAFEGRPSVMSDVLSQGLLTLLERGPCSEPLLDPSNPLTGRSLDLAQGFQLKTRLWASAADFMHHLNFLTSPNKQQQQQQQQTTMPMQSLLETPDWTKLVDLHQTFLGILDDLPTCLRSPNGVISNGAGDDPIGTYQAQSFWALRNNIISVYHCMRLVILQECVLQGIPEILGLENKAESLVLRKLEIVQDFLLEMQLAPFMCLKVQGEAAVRASILFLLFSGGTKGKRNGTDLTQPLTLDPENPPRRMYITRDGEPCRQRHAEQASDIAIQPDPRRLNKLGLESDGNGAWSWCAASRDE